MDKNGWIKQQGILLAEWIRLIFCQPIECGRCHSPRQEPGKTPSHNDVPRRAARTVQTVRHTIRRTVCLGLIAIVSPFPGCRFLTTLHDAATTLAKLALALPWVVEATHGPALKGWNHLEFSNYLSVVGEESHPTCLQHKHHKPWISKTIKRDLYACQAGIFKK